MLDNPIRGIMFHSPSSTEAYSVPCSFCDHKSWAKPDRIEPEEMARWEAHECDRWCNGFDCMKRYVSTGGNEFYIANEKHLMCYKCKQLEGSENYILRPFTKLPQNAEIYSKPSDSVTTKTTEWYKETYPRQFETKPHIELNKSRC